MMGTCYIRGIGLGNTSTKQLRKYLGDPIDPHFVPQSPLIDRQIFTAYEEEELSRLCTLALENVPHSDGDIDDPLRYLASQITVREEQSSSQKEDRKLSNHGFGQTNAMEFAPSCGAETATPSETSKRETLQTDATTPMTTPGVTPGETGKRFSDVGKRPVTNQSSTWRNGTKPVKASMVYSFLNEPLPDMPSFLGPASKSMSNLPNLSEERSEQYNLDQMQHSHLVPMGRPDFNKSLPAIPNLTKERTHIEEQPKAKSSTITRMLKTVRLRRIQTSPVVGPRSTSSDLTSRHKDLLQRPASKKHKFNPFTFLHKRTSINTKRATVG